MSGEPHCCFSSEPLQWLGLCTDEFIQVEIGINVLFVLPYPWAVPFHYLPSVLRSPAGIYFDHPQVTVWLLPGSVNEPGRSLVVQCSLQPIAYLPQAQLSVSYSFECEQCCVVQLPRELLYQLWVGVGVHGRGGGGVYPDGWEALEEMRKRI